MFDLHVHVLAGLDDGPPDTAGSLALARAAVDAGTNVVVATPHIGTEHGVEPLAVAGEVAELERRLREADIPLTVLTGGEIAPAGLPDLSDEALAAVALGGGRCVLLECPFTPIDDVLPLMVDDLRRRRFRVLLAHPERSPSLVSNPAAVEALVARGAFVQITAAALEGRFGRRAWRLCSVLLKQGLVHAVASDAHDAVHRPPVVRRVLERAIWEQGLPGELAQHLLERAPCALLQDAPLPPAPLPRRRWLRSRRR